MRFDLICFSGLSLMVMGVAGCGARAGVPGAAEEGFPITVMLHMAGTPAAVATKVGTGEFAVQSVNSGTISLSIPTGSANFAVAVNCPADTNTSGEQTVTWYSQILIEASLLDGTDFTVPYCGSDVSRPTMGTLTGSVDTSAFPDTDTVQVMAVNGSWENSIWNHGASVNFSMQAPVGADRVLVGAYGIGNEPGEPWGTSLLALKNFDGVTVPGALNGGATVMLAAADAVRMQPITYSNLPTKYETPDAYAWYQLKGGAGMQLSFTATDQYPALPPGSMQTGDYYVLEAFTYNQDHPEEEMYVVTTTTSGGPQVFKFPVPWSYAGPAPAALPTFDMTYARSAGWSGAVKSGAIQWTVFSTPTTEHDYSYQVFASSNYLGASPTLTLPDLSGLPGFLPLPPSGSEAYWMAWIDQGTLGFLPGANMANIPMATDVELINQGMFTVP